MIPKLAGARVLVWGWGRHGGGAAAVRRCQALGAQVEVLDRQSATDLGTAMDLPWHVGDAGHPAFARADLIVASPAIPPRAWPIVHPPRTCPEALFFAAHQGRIATVTGTKGKSTTVRMLSTLLGWPAGGNSYEPLLDVQDAHGPQADLVAELSSFQLWYLAQGQVPQLELAVLTSLAVDHLDWHPDVLHYHGAKRALFSWAKQGIGRDLPGLKCPVTYREGRFLYAGEVVAQRADLPLPGDHNASNAALAIAAALALGLDPAVVRERLRAVVGLPHRLAQVHAQGRFVFVDDSIATTPEAAMCALAAIHGPLAVILGGSDKGADFAELAKAVTIRGAIPVLIGVTAPRLAAALAGHRGSWHRAADLETAIEAACRSLPEGGTILLSPACASFDMFQGFEDRGRKFAAAARAAR